jgi:uncharacterized protein YndB with AHSA1/START domain
MARNQRYVPVPPERVFDVLSDARQYGHVVVGSKEIRHWDPGWPAADSQLHHTIGYGPLNIKDSTRVVAADPPHRLELLARALPLGRARVVFELRPAKGGTEVSVDESPQLPGLARLLSAPLHALTLVRNSETLRRLAETAQKPAEERERIAAERGAAPTS